jgi:hypothetical protein
MTDGVSAYNEDKKDDIFGGISGLLDGHIQVKPRSKGRVQLELAPNPLEFIESPKFLDGPALHYPQYAVVRDFFELLCPNCNDLEDIYSNIDPLMIGADDDAAKKYRDKQILFRYNTCPKCGFNKMQNPRQFNNFNELIGVVGMRGGKSVLVACMSAAIIHELLCVDGLQEKLGLVKSQEIDGAFVAASGEQASETIYGHFRGFYDNSPWFQNYRRALLDLEILDSSLRRGDLYWATEKSIHFKEKHIRIKSLTSNSGSIAGKTRIFAVIDELSRMDAGDSKRSATEVYRVLKRSLITIKASVDRLRRQGMYNVPDARMFCISSPMFEDDKSMMLLKQAEKSDKMFAFHRTTWEFNPDISKEDLADEFATDPLGAERDYAANPPGAENPLVVNTNIIEICVDKHRSSNFLIREVFFDEVLDEFKFNYIKTEIIDFQYKNLVEYVIHCDAGQRQDSFCLALGHLDDDVVVIDGAVECRPIHKNNKQGLSPREVYFPAMTDIILKLARTLSIRFVSYDRWNSTEQIHKLRTGRILAFQKNLSRDDHIRFVNSMAASKISFPARENEFIDPSIARNMPCAKALWELKRLNDDGQKVDHPPGGSSDMIQCYVGVHRLLLHPEEVISVPELKKEQRKQRIRGSRRRKIGQVIKLPPKGSRR